jgi:multidrug resistance efflux pump
MSWGRLLLLGDWGQQLAIEDVEADVVRLRSRLRNQRSTDRSQGEALITLRREVTDLKLVVAELTRLLVATGTLPTEAVERLVRGVDQASAPEEQP